MLGQIPSPLFICEPIMERKATSQVRGDAY